jgi:hypothetical protein
LILPEGVKIGEFYATINQKCGRTDRIAPTDIYQSTAESVSI